MYTNVHVHIQLYLLDTPLTNFEVICTSIIIAKQKCACNVKALYIHIILCIIYVSIRERGTPGIFSI